MPQKKVSLKEALTPVAPKKAEEFVHGGGKTKKMGRPASFTGPAKKLTLNIPAELHRNLRFRAAEEDRPIQAIVIEAVEKLLHK